jgi:hypothetical protein
MKQIAQTLTLSILFLLTVFSGDSRALIMGVKGNKPTTDHNWPEGTLALANLKIRLGWWAGPPFGGGEYHFLYRGDTKAFADSLDKFSKIIAPKKVLVIHDGTNKSFWLRGAKDPGINWEFTVWTPESWHHLYNNPMSHHAADQPNFRQPVAAPRLEVFLSGTIDWSKITVPQGITITDRRLSSVGLDASAGAVVRGQVFDMHTSKPIVDAELMLEPREDNGTKQTIRSDKRGQFDLRQVPQATYHIWVQAKGYASRRLGYEAIGKQTLLVYENIQLARATELSGTLKDNSGISISDAKIRLRNPMGIDGRGYPLPATATTQTNASGQFTFTGLPTGFTQFQCSAEGYHFSGLFGVHQVPGKDPELKMTATGIIRVRVVDQDGLPLQGNHIINIDPEGDPIGKWGGSAKVDIKAGENVFKRVPPGRYQITAHPNPHSSRSPGASKWIEVSSTKEIEVELKYRVGK